MVLHYLSEIKPTNKYSVNLNNRFPCEDSYGGYLCQESTNSDNTTSYLTLGRVISYSLLNTTAPRKGILVQYLNSSYDSSCPNGRNASLALICDDNTGALNLVSSTGCSISFEWPTLYACPLCSNVDFTTSYTPCVNNSKLRVYSYASPQYCHDGLPPPASVPQNCTTCTTAHYSSTYDPAHCGICGVCKANTRQLSFYWIIPKTCQDGVSLPPTIQDPCTNCSTADMHYILSECVDDKQTRTYNWIENKTCVDGIDLLPDSINSCDEPWKFGSPIVIGVSVGATILVLLLGGILVKLYLKNRKLYANYTKLKEQGSNDPTLDDPFDNAESKSNDSKRDDEKDEEKKDETKDEVTEIKDTEKN